MIRIVLAIALTGFLVGCGADGMPTKPEPLEEKQTESVEQDETNTDETSAAKPAA